VTHHTILTDSHAELISGGTGSTWISLVSFKKVSTGIGQTNNVTNVGIGFFGHGIAGSVQGNAADVANFVG
jgi:hypothetical protein